MKTFSAILTGINKVNIPFKDQINLKKQATTPELLLFAKHQHKNADISTSVESVSVYTNYIYFTYGSYFKKTNCNTGTSVFYKVS